MGLSLAPKATKPVIASASFSAPKGLNGIVTTSLSDSLCSWALRFSAPKGLNGIVTLGDFILPLELLLSFQCPEGLEWDCHDIIWEQHEANTWYWFQCPEGLEWDCHMEPRTVGSKRSCVFQCPEGLEWDCHKCRTFRIS